MVNINQPLQMDTTMFLENLQGNILKGHGRSHTRHLLLRFELDEKSMYAARQWLSKFARQYATSALQQYVDSQAHKKGDAKEKLFAMVLLSAKGYRALSIEEGEWPTDHAFQQGMAERPISDPPQKDWDDPYQKNLHAMILLAHESLKELDREASEIEKEITAFAQVIGTERGEKLLRDFSGTNDAKQVIEHFGYTDGISQPLLIKQDIDEARPTGHLKWDPAADLDLVLVAEPRQCDDGTTTYGSYMVFRKLEQNVSRFRERFVNQHAGSQAVGRKPDGTPLISPEQGIHNNFNYEEDLEGKKCPVNAHIRRVNDRKKSSPRIVRRGITYGQRPDLGENGGAPPEKDVGLLFMSFQANIGEQFEELQEQVATDALNDKMGDGANLITLKGGEYFFAPSLPFLRGLAMLSSEQRDNLSKALKQLLGDEQTLVKFGGLWNSKQRIAAMETVGITRSDFRTLYAAYDPSISRDKMIEGRELLFQSVKGSRETVVSMDEMEARREYLNQLVSEAEAVLTPEQREYLNQSVSEAEAVLTPEQKARLVKALNLALRPDILEKFIQLWPSDPVAALALVHLTAQDTVDFYNYLSQKGRITLPWPFWI